MEIKSASLFISEKSAGAENDGDKKTASKHFELLGFCKRTINHQPNGSLAFQQHTSGQFSAIHPCLWVVFDLRTHPPICNLQL